jgi:hypothetical protein
MLPALSAYLGQVGLGSTERYLSLTRALSKVAREVESSTQKKEMALESRIDQILGGVVKAD